MFASEIYIELWKYESKISYLKSLAVHQYLSHFISKQIITQKNISSYASHDYGNTVVSDSNIFMKIEVSLCHWCTVFRSFVKVLSMLSLKQLQCRSGEINCISQIETSDQSSISSTS